MIYKKTTVLLVLFCIIISNKTYSEKLSDNLVIYSIKPDVYIVTHSYPWESNSLLLIMENGDLLLIDTPYTPEATGLILKWINKNFGKRKILAVNTHFHIDRLGGNEILLKSGIPIYSSELTIDAIKSKGKESISLFTGWIKDEKIKSYYMNFKYFLPDKIFDSKKGLTLNFGKEKAEIKYYGIGHSLDNLIVYLPDKKLLFGGCMILSIDAKNCGNVSDGNIKEWRKTLGKLDTTGYDLVIPGHGNYGGIELINKTKKLLDSELIK